MLEQWAKNHGISPNRVSQIFLPVPLLLSQPIRKTQQKPCLHPQTDLIQVVPSKQSNLKGSRNGHEVQTFRQVNDDTKQNGVNSLSNPSSNETRTRRLIRSVYRVTRRFHVLRHLRQRGDTQTGNPSTFTRTRSTSSRFSRMSFRRLTSRSKSRNVKISSPLQVTRDSTTSQGNIDPRSKRQDSNDSSTHNIEENEGTDTVDDGIVYATICHESLDKNKKKQNNENQLGAKEEKDEVTVRRRPPRRRRHTHDDENNSYSDASCSNNRISDVDKHKRRVVFLEKQVLIQQEEIQTLREVIEDLRSSLQLSDAQNLALQVLLKKMSKAESSLLPTYASNGYSLSSSMKNTPEEDSCSPTSPSKEYTSQYKLFSNGINRKVPNGNVNNNSENTNFKFRSQMDESEKQLENLVKELKEMSQTMYPPSNYLLMQNQFGLNNNNNHNTISITSSGSTFNGGGISYQDIDPLQDEITKTSKVLNGTKDELKATQQELQQTANRLHQKESELEENSVNLKNAYKALEKAQKELLKMR